MQEYRIHPAYKRSTNDYDVSILRIFEKFQYGPTIQPIVIATSPAKLGDPMIVTGWGDTTVNYELHKYTLLIKF